MIILARPYIPAILWAIIILYLSAFSGPQIDLNFSFVAPDKVSHFAAYGLLSVLVGWGYFRQQFRLKEKKELSIKVFLIILVIGFTYGVLMELMQYLFLPNRYFEYGDMFANFIGSFFGLVIIRIYCLNIK
jgi:VanZ family protein